MYRIQKAQLSITYAQYHGTLANWCDGVQIHQPLQLKDYIGVLLVQHLQHINSALCHSVCGSYSDPKTRNI